MDALKYLHLVVCLTLFISQATFVNAHEEFIDVIASSKPSIVRIEVSRTTKSIKSQAAVEALGEYADFFSHDTKEKAKKGRGTGFVVNYDENQFVYIVTAAHVVRGASKVKVIFNGVAKSKKADVIWSNHKSDVALLKVKSKSYIRPLKLEVDDVKEGQAVVALSDSFNVSISGSQGIVSAVDVVLPAKKGVKFIQTDAATNPGSSGGALLNKDGRVVGMISTIYTNTGTFTGDSFAVPARIVYGMLMSNNK